jgi:hypothetical protein
VVAGLCAALALGACKYGYDNPAERLRPGLVTGRTVADLAAQGTPQPTGGIAVSLKGSAFDQVTHPPTGRFGMLPLPAGPHTLLFRRGTELALVRRVQLELGRDGQPDAVELGDVRVPFAGEIDGLVSDAVHDGLVLDETTGITAGAAGGAYRFQGASVGPHRLKAGLFSTALGLAWVGGPIDVTLGDEAQSAVTHAARLVVHPAAGTGRLRLTVVSLHPDISPPEVTVTLEDAVRGPLAGVPSPDARGLVELDAPEGVYRVRLVPPATHAAEVTLADPATAVVIAGELADVGSLYLVPPGVVTLAQARCQDDAECGDTPCTAGACERWTPPAVAPATLPFCFTRTDLCGAGRGCRTPYDEAGECLLVSTNRQACVPCGTRCALFGAVTLQASPPNPASGLCP